MFDPAALRELRNAASEIVAFADRREGEEWQTAGRWFKRQGNKTVRIAKPGSKPSAPPKKSRGLLGTLAAPFKALYNPVRKRYGKTVANVASALAVAPGSIVTIPPLLAIAELDRQVRGAPKPEAKPKRQRKPKAPQPPPSPGPEAIRRADPAAVIRKNRTEVRGKPIVASAGPTGNVATSDPKPANLPVSPITGPADLQALKASVDAGVEADSTRGWTYDFRKAHEALKNADAQIDEFARTAPPEKLLELAESVTKIKPTSPEHAHRLLRAWVAETVELLRGMPGVKPRLDPLGNLPRMSEKARYQQFAELRSRAAGFERLISSIGRNGV